MEKVTRGILLITVGLCGSVAISFITALILMLCVNWALHSWINAVPLITYWQAFGVMLIVSLSKATVITKQ